MTAPELKPCPFCGGNASISKDHDPDGSGAFYAVKCRKCRAKSPEIYAVETCDIHFAQVRDAWNRRADLAAVQAAQVRVKPLVWEEDEHGNFRAKSVRGGEGVDRLTEPQVIGDNRVIYEAWGIKGEFDTPQEAQAAVEAEILPEIIATLEPHPDPRDEVVKMMPEVIAALRSDGLNVSLASDLVAALAAAKKVLK